MKLILAITAVVLFSTSFWLCKLATSDVDVNTDLRYSSYAIICVLCFSIAQIKVDNFPKATRFVLEIGAGLSVSDILDRFVFDITTFEKNDLIMIAATIAVAVFNYKKK